MPAIPVALTVKASFSKLYRQERAVRLEPVELENRQSHYNAGACGTVRERIRCIAAARD